MRLIAYFIHAAAIIATLDSSWINGMNEVNRDWVNALVRDAASPIAAHADGYFPFSRSFDWFHGHSFAKGLFESADGKDQESSSEDAFFSYAIKMWGCAIGDSSMEARGNLMLAIQARSFRHYFLMENDNTIQPHNFIANKVTGIVSVITSYCTANQVDFSSSLKTRSTTRRILGQISNTSKGMLSTLHPTLYIIFPFMPMVFQPNISPFFHT